MSDETAFALGLGLAAGLVLLVVGALAACWLWGAFRDWREQRKSRREWPLQVHRRYVADAVTLFQEWMKEHGDAEAVRGLSWGTRVWLANNPVSRPNTPG